MRKIGLALAIVGVLALQAPVAESHGSCAAKASNLQRSTTQIVYTGKFDCVSTVHDALNITVYLQKRMPGGSWSIEDIVTNNVMNRTIVVGQETHIGEDCNKEYRARVDFASASPGGHTGTKNGQVSLSYC